MIPAIPRNEKLSVTRFVTLVRRLNFTISSNLEPHFLEMFGRQIGGLFYVSNEETPGAG